MDARPADFRVGCVADTSMAGEVGRFDKMSSFLQEHFSVIKGGKCREAVHDFIGSVKSDVKIVIIDIRNFEDKFVFSA